MMKIIKYLAFIFLFFISLFSAWWISSHVSDIHVIVDNMDVSINPILFVIAIISTYLILHFALYIIGAIVNIPSYIVSFFYSDEHKGTIDLEKIMVAFFSNDLDAAARHLKNARKAGINENLLILLEAQYHKLSGQVQLAIDQYHRLVDVKEYKGFICQELSLLYEDIDAITTALEFAKQAFELLQNQETMERLIACYSKLNQWSRVLALMENHDNKKLISSPKANDVLYSCYYAMAVEEYKKGAYNEALFLAESSKQSKVEYCNIALTMLSLIHLHDYNKAVKTMVKYCEYFSILDICCFLELLVQHKLPLELYNDFKKSLNMDMLNALVIMAKISTLAEMDKESKMYIAKLLELDDFESQSWAHLLMAESRAKTGHGIAEIPIMLKKLYRLEAKNIEYKVLQC